MIKRSAFEIDASEARTLVAGRIPNPTVGIAWNEAPALSRPGDANEQDVWISQEIEFPTKRGSRVDVADAETRIQRLRYDRVVIVVKSLVGQSFYRLLYSQKRTQQLRAELELVRDLEKLVTARYGAGASSYLDMVRTRIESARLGNDVIEARTGLEAHRRELSLLLGIESTQIGALAGDFPELVNVTDAETSVRVLSDESILFKIALETERRGEHTLSLAKSSYLPDFEVGVARQRRGTVSSLWGIELQASIPLWFWMEPAGQVREAAAQIEIASVDRLALRRRVEANIRDALGALSAAESQVVVFDQSLLADARDIVATATKQYQNGMMDILNLLEVFRTYRATQAEYLRARFNHAMALTHLEAAAELPSDGQIDFGVQP